MKHRQILALGFFDGVHLGHQALLEACHNLAWETGSKPGVITFTAHPKQLLSGEAPGLLNTIEDRRLLLHSLGIETVVELPFDEKLMTTHWSTFLSRLTQEGAAGFVCGDDFRFGAGGCGTAKKLAAFCESRHMPYAVVAQQQLDGVRVRSTHIRTLLERGEMEQAARFLGHPHILTGEVVAGRQIGRTIGVPTANLLLPEGLLCPRYGVYASKALFDGQEYPAVTNIGTRPTVGGHQITVEPWILDYTGDLYGKKLTLAFYKFLRPERKFGSLEELKAEIQKNAAQTLEFFSNY